MNKYYTMVQRSYGGKQIFVPGGKYWSHGKKPNSNCCDNCAKHRDNHFKKTVSSGIDLGVVNFKSEETILFCYQ